MEVLETGWLCLQMTFCEFGEKLSAFKSEGVSHEMCFIQQSRTSRHNATAAQTETLPKGPLSKGVAFLFAMHNTLLVHY